MLNYLKTYFRSLPKTKKGQALVEYGLIIGLIAVVCIVALGLMGGHLQRFFEFINTKLTAVTTA